MNWCSDACIQVQVRPSAAQLVHWGHIHVNVANKVHLRENILSFIPSFRCEEYGLVSPAQGLILVVSLAQSRPANRLQLHDHLIPIERGQ